LGTATSLATPIILRTISQPPLTSALPTPVPADSPPAPSSPAPTLPGRIAFVTQWQSGPSYYQDIYLANADGTDLVNITEANDSNVFDYLSWAPDGAELAFLSDGPGGVGIYTMDAEGSGFTYLADGTQPTWSPDGSMIAFRRSHLSEQWWQWHLVVISADGTGEHIIASDLGDQGTPSWTTISWSPDSRTIAFTMWAGHSEQVFVVNSDGSTLRQLTFAEDYPRDYSRGPFWSPDGRLIAFSRPSGIYAVAPHTSEAMQLMRLEWGYLAFPGWSPDSSRVVAYSDYGLYQLTLGALYPDRVLYTRPGCAALSPDGSMVSYLAPIADTGVSDLMVIDLPTSASWEVAEISLAGLGCPVWQP
jgi:Tol biopolymer transport system component